MAEKRFIYDQNGTITREVVIDEQANGDIVTHYITHDNLDLLFKSIEQQRDEYTGKEVFRPVAEISPAIVEQAVREGWYHDKKAWKRFLNDPDNRAFRIWTGQL